MSDSHESPRRYDEGEVERILARAAELEAEGETAPADPRGLTLAELERIGAEAGFRPGLLRRAARELDSDEPRRRAPANALLGAPAAVRLEREVEGEATRPELERLIVALRRVDGAGHAAIVGDILSWQSSDEGRNRVLGVTVSSSDGRTRIWMAERLGQFAGGLFGGLVGGLGGAGTGVGLAVGLGGLGPPGLALAIPLAALGASYVLARRIYRSHHRGRVQTLSHLMERMVAELERGRAGGGARGGAGGAGSAGGGADTRS